MEDIYFIDNDGNKVYSDTIKSHIGLAKMIIENNKEMQLEIQNSNVQDIVDFIVQNKGYMKVSDLGRFYKVVTFSSKRLTKKQKDILYFLAEEGYKFDDLSNLRQSKDNGR